MEGRARDGDGCTRGVCTYGHRGWTEVHTELTMVFVCFNLAGLL